MSVRHNIARASGKLENDRVKNRNPIQLILLLCALGASVAACGSSGSGSSSSTPSSAPPTSAPASAPASPSASPSAAAPAGGSAAATIAANWTAFFNAKTPVAKRVSLLQDGQQFASIISAQAGNSLASSASAKVTKVTVTSPTQAAVTYSIVEAGQTALPNQKGTAVLEGGTWKVGLASFCGLLTLEKSFGIVTSLPTACSAA